MPSNELPELDSEQQHRIKAMAMASRYIKLRQSGGNNVDNVSIMNDVNLDFARTMNWIIMEKTMEKTLEQLKDMIPANLTLPPKAPSRETPYFGMTPIP